jgi:hypothetical protein
MRPSSSGDPRTELARPELQFLSNEQYNQLFTMRSTIMVLLYATPTVFGFANYILPLQIGSPDVAFPRLNAFSYTPLSDAVHSPGARAAGFRAALPAHVRADGGRGACGQQACGAVRAGDECGGTGRHQRK